MHNTCLDKIIEKYKNIFEKKGHTLKKVIVWSDNCPSQYRCRQNFLQIAMVRERHDDIELIHRLAVVDNFKGPHDGYGKQPKWYILEQEKVMNRSPTAYKAFVVCKNGLSKETEAMVSWKKFEMEQDVKLKGKGTYGLDGRYFFYVVETKEQQITLEKDHPGEILLCDRSKILDTKGKKCVEKTTQLHEICSVYEKKGNEQIGKQEKFSLKTSFMPCSCIHCRSRQDSNSNLPDLCKYKNRRKTKVVTITCDRRMVDGAGAHGDDNAEKTVVNKK